MKKSVEETAKNILSQLTGYSVEEVKDIAYGLIREAEKTTIIQ